MKREQGQLFCKEKQGLCREEQEQLFCKEKQGLCREEQGQRIVYYKDEEERLAILQELKKNGFGCKNAKIDFDTCTQKQIDEYIDQMPIGIDFEKREFFSCSVTIAIHGRALFMSTADVLEVLKNARQVEPHPNLKIF